MFGLLVLVFMGQGRTDELPEQGVSFHRTGLELRVELAADKPWMVLPFDNLYEIPFRAQSARDESLLGKGFSVGVVDLIPMTMSFPNL